MLFTVVSHLKKFGSVQPYPFLQAIYAVDTKEKAYFM